jgi:beta-lactamase class A
MPYDRNQKRTPRSSLRYSLILLAVFALGTGVVLLSVFVSGHFPRALAKERATAHRAEASRRSSATFQPGYVPVADSIDTLSSSLSSYLSTLGPNVGVEVYDVTRQQAYAYNGAQQFLTASSIKVPIMLTFFAMTENQGREPNSNEMALLTAMIEHSDNDAASALFSEIGGATGIANYIQGLNVSGLTPDNDAWGYSQITPQAMVTLLTELHAGTILTATDRATALSLMQNVETDQRWGVGDTAPAGASFAMKNGWVPGPDGLWSVNTSGIIEAGGETYIISVYTQEQSSLADGQAIVQQVCGTVASLLA